MLKYLHKKFRNPSFRVVKIQADRRSVVETIAGMAP